MEEEEEPKVKGHIMYFRINTPPPKQNTPPPKSEGVTIFAGSHHVCYDAK